MIKFLKSLIIVAFMMVGNTALAHTSKEVAGMNIVFGGEPEPMLDGERQHLVWRFSDAKSKEPVANLKDLKLTITFKGKNYGVFTARGSRRTPGTYRTSHIFTKPGEGEAVLTFMQGGSDEVHSVTFSLTVYSRQDLEIGGHLDTLK